MSTDKDYKSLLIIHWMRTIEAQASTSSNLTDDNL